MVVLGVLRARLHDVLVVDQRVVRVRRVVERRGAELLEVLARDVLRLARHLEPLDRAEADVERLVRHLGQHAGAAVTDLGGVAADLLHRDVVRRDDVDRVRDGCAAGVERDGHRAGRRRSRPAELRRRRSRRRAGGRLPRSPRAPGEVDDLADTDVLARVGGTRRRGLQRRAGDRRPGGSGRRRRRRGRFWDGHLRRGRRRRRRVEGLRLVAPADEQLLLVEVERGRPAQRRCRQRDVGERPRHRRRADSFGGQPRRAGRAPAWVEQTRRFDARCDAEELAERGRDDLP